MRNILVLILFLIPFFSKSQITGRVVDNNDEPLPSAAVVLIKSDAIITGTTTDPEGKFRLNPPATGTYQVEISFISFQTRTITVETGTGPVNLGTVQLQESSGTLEEVTVESQAKMMEFQQDKRVFNVSKDLTSAGSNASDILNNVPSVSVDVEGNVSLRGSQNVRILIDGKPSGLIGTDPANALRQLQANMIEKIEVITNPSARYDAEGEAGIINIILKKDQRPGLNGTFEVTTGYPHNHGASAGINYRAGRFNWFANGSLTYRRSPGGGFSEQQFSDSGYSFTTDREQTRGGTSGALRLGADYALTPDQTLTGTFLYRPSLGGNHAQLTYRDYNAAGELIQTAVREDDEIEDELTLEGDLHYEKRFKNEDHKWTVDFKYQDDNDHEDSDIRQYTLFPDTAGSPGDIIQHVSNQEDERTILFQTDYLRPWSKVRKFETGAKATLRDIINDYSVEQQDESGIFYPLPEFTNNFRYRENIYAAYAIYSDGFGEITYQAGLRSELSDITTELFDENEINNKQYINFFPSLFFTWKINVLSDLQLNYSRRLSRPHFRALLPFSSFSDTRNFRQGNPDLNPEFTDSYEAGYVRYFESATLYSGIYYRHRTGVIERITVSNDTGFTTFPVNLAIQDAYGFEFNLSYDITTWWNVNGNVNLYRAITTGDYEGTDYGSDNLTSQGRIMNRLSFWNSDLQLSFNFRGPATTSQGRDLGIYTADLGWSKDILKGKGTITASVQDIFNTRKRRSYTNGENFEIYSEFQWRRRQFLLTFSYRLNQRKTKKPGSNGNSFDGDDEFGM